MDTKRTQEIERIRAQLKAGFAYQDSKPGGVREGDCVLLKVPEARAVLKLLAELTRLQAIEAAAGEVVRDMYWYEDAAGYLVDGEALETLRDALKGAGE